MKYSLINEEKPENSEQIQSVRQKDKKVEQVLKSINKLKDPRVDKKAIRNNLIKIRIWYNPP